jgi:hypothetical protein
MQNLRIISICFLLFCCGNICAQEKFKGNFTNDELKIKLALDLYENKIPVPGFELDSCYGYLQGNLNGNWIILKVKSIDDNKAVVRAVSEKGSDAQDLMLTFNENGFVVMRQKNEINIKGVKGRKYVKLPKDIVFEK